LGVRSVLALLCTISLATSAHGQALPILPDGLFDDWATATVLHTDPAGDQAASDIDFGRLWAANDSDRLYLRFEIGVEKKLQENNGIALYVDSDNSASTGLAVGGIGAEFAWFFGVRSGTAYFTNGSEAGSSNWFPFGLRQEPTVSGDDFEVAFDRGAVVSGVTLFPGPTIAVLLQNEDGGVQDRLPDVTQTVTYTFDGAAVPPPSTISFDKVHPDHVRVVSHNALFDGLFDRPDPFERILLALDPDIICFQEIFSHTATEARDQVASFLGGTWFAAQQSDNITVSRWPIATTRAIDGNLGTLIDLPSTPHTTDLYIINAHLPCCSNEAGRQDESDAIIAWIRDLQSPGGVETLTGGTPIAVTGDMNFVGFRQQVATLLTGDIQNEATHGADHPPDWDVSAMTDLLPRHTAAREAYTWRNDGGSFPPGRLDYMVYTDSAMAVGNHFLLWTPTMAPAELTAAGLFASDTADAADHVPVVVDLIIPGSAIPAGVTILGADE
jgi:endonuclease/exonuclease/phosphatase family metal-dependent hydrolase